MSKRQVNADGLSVENNREPWLKRLFYLTQDGYLNLKKAIVACALTNLAMMLPFMVSFQVLNEVIKPLSGQHVQTSRLWMLFACGLLCALIIYFASKNDYKKTYISCYRESERTRVQMAEHIRKLPMSVFNSKDLSEMTTNLMGDVAVSEHVLSHLIPQLFGNMASAALICLMLALFEWKMACAVFVTIPLAFIIIFLTRGLQGRLGSAHAKAKLNVSLQVQEYLEGIKVIHSCGLDGEKFSALDQALRSMKALAIRFELISGTFITGAGVVLQSGIGLTILCGILLLSKGSIDFVTMVSFLFIVTRMYGPFLTELVLLPELFYYQTAIGRMKKLMSLEIMQGDDQIKIDDYNIHFQNVSFSYRQGSEPVLHDVCCTLPANGITALVGPSGSGKSTLAKLIARFWDADQGRILIGNVDVRSVEPEHLMSYLSFVFQDVVLFNDTIFNNIKIGNPEATDEDVIAAGKAARCDDFALKLKDGYQSMLGENGATLSGGERQRLSIARALLKDAPIILLDEATASLDPENEALVQEALSRLIAGKTVVVIAHRLRTIAEADHIIVLESGRVKEEGTHESLLSNKSLYHHLYTLQQESQGWSVSNI